MGRQGFAAVFGLLLMTAPAWAADGDVVVGETRPIEILMIRQTPPVQRGPVLPVLSTVVAVQVLPLKTAYLRPGLVAL